MSFLEGGWWKCQFFGAWGFFRVLLKQSHVETTKVMHPPFGSL